MSGPFPEIREQLDHLRRRPRGGARVGRPSHFRRRELWQGTRPPEEGSVTGCTASLGTVLTTSSSGVRAASAAAEETDA